MLDLNEKKLTMNEGFSTPRRTTSWGFCGYLIVSDTSAGRDELGLQWGEYGDWSVV